MKRLVLVTFLCTPFLAFAQAEPNSTSLNLVTGLIAIGIMIGLFWLFRSIVLWYWKVDTIVTNQEKQIRIQQETNNLLSEQIGILKREREHQV